MRKYSLFCDCCGKEVENLYTINFKAAEGSEGDDYYLPDIEICEDCIDETCGLLKEWLTSPDVVVEDEGNEEVKNNEMVAQSYGNYPDVDCHIPAIVCDTYEDCATCPYNNDTDKTNIPDLKDCNELENGETPTSCINFNEAIQNLNNLTEQFYNATSAPAQNTASKVETKDSSNFQFELTEDDVYEAIELSRASSNINLNISEPVRKTIFHTIYGFSKKDYTNNEQYKKKLYDYLDSLKTEDERKYALLCSYGMAACDKVTTMAMPILGLMGLAL